MASFPRSALLLVGLGLSLTSCQANIVIPAEGRISHLTSPSGAPNDTKAPEANAARSASQPAIAMGQSSGSAPTLTPIGLPIASRPITTPVPQPAAGDCAALVGRVSTFDPRWNLRAFDDFGSTRDLVGESVDMSFDGRGNTYYAVHVSRQGSIGKVFMKVTPEGKNLFCTPGEGWAPTLTAMMPSLPWGDMQADSEGRLYYSYLGTGSGSFVFRMSADGKTVDAFDGAPYTINMALNARGDVYFVDQAGHMVRRLTADDKLEVVAGNGMAGSIDGRGSAARFNNLGHITVEPTGNFLVSESGNGPDGFYRLRRVTPAGEVTTLLLRTRVDGELKQPRINVSGLAVDARGTIYVTDSVRHLVYRGTEVAGSIELSAWLGQEGLAGYAEGVGPQARFKFPSNMIMDGCNRLLMFDDGNRVIRQIQ
jgi:hypothetical protein